LRVRGISLRSGLPARLQHYVPVIAMVGGRIDVERRKGKAGRGVRAN
jgi:hypothetical protein